MKTQKAILAVLAGTAAGVALGALLTPHKGSDTRRKISKKSQDLADALNEKISERFEELLSSVAGKVKKSNQPGSSTGSQSEMVG